MFSEVNVLERARQVAVGPANYAGQASAWAMAITQELDVPAFSFDFAKNPFRRPRSFAFDVDRRVPHHRLTSRLMKRLWVDSLLRSTTHLALDGFLPLYDRIDRTSLGDELERHRRNRSVALIAHGSDVRDPVGHQEREEFSYFRDAPPEYVSLLRMRSAENRAIALQSGLPLLVSTPDLIEDLPGANWLPLVVSPVINHAQQVNAKPVILHGPSSRRPAIKGSEWIDSVLRGLEAAGRITYLCPQRVTHQEFLTLIAGSDIVVDQILSGSYGVTSVEAMIAGKITVANVSTWVQAHLPEPVPTVPATPDSFGEVINEILDDLPRYRQEAKLGQAFATRWHTGRASALALASALGIDAGQQRF